MEDNTSIVGWARNEIIELVNEVTELVDLSDNDDGLDIYDSSRLVENGTRACRLIDHLYSNTEIMTVQIHKLVEDKEFGKAWRGNNTHVSSLLGILKAVSHEIDNNRVAKVRDLMREEVFTDFLEMAEYLLSEGFKHAAAVIAGGVLENVLRDIANNLGIPVVHDNGKPLTIGSLNAALYKAEVYKPLQKKQIDTSADIRNAAAHGRYNDYKKDDVVEMIKFITRFADEIINRILLPTPQKTQ